MKKVLIADMTWPEYSERIKEETLLLPIGSTEQHGYHMPLGTDAYQITRLAMDVAQRTAAIVAPTVNYGYKSQPYSGGGQLFPTTSLSADTLIAVTKDILLEFIRHGAKKIMLMDGHYENSWFLTEAVDLTLKEYGKTDVKIIKTCFVNLMDLELCDVLWPEGFPGFDLEHAGLIETSLMLYYFPELVDMSKAVSPGKVVFPIYEEFPLYEGQVPACGCLADPMRSTAEFGQLIAESIIKNHVKSIEEAFGKA